MRLLEISGRGELSFTEDLKDDIPRYAILSHTWGRDTEEVKFNDLGTGLGKDKQGYSKIQFCQEQAHKDAIQHFWVDTCCIDKSSSAELAEAIISMYQWYCTVMQQSVMYSCPMCRLANATMKGVGDRGNPLSGKADGLHEVGRCKSSLLQCRSNSIQERECA
jgi:hypothetical protein